MKKTLFRNCFIKEEINLNKKARILKNTGLSVFLGCGEGRD
jgi:hypothetical protein